MALVKIRRNSQECNEMKIKFTLMLYAKVVPKKYLGNQVKMGKKEQAT
jgi:hypothetical protein